MHDHFSHVLHGLYYGFSLGLEEFTLHFTYSLLNHCRDTSHHAFVLEKYDKECILGRISEEFDPQITEQLFGFYRTAPLNVIEHTPGKMCITVNHSFPHNNLLIPSVNSQIDTKQFQCDWGIFSACWLLVANASSDTQVAVFDVESAFRIIPTRPCKRVFTALCIANKITFDHRLNFGISPAPGIFGSVADTIVHIYLSKGIDTLLKWVDDFIFFRYPHYQSDRTLYYNYSEDLIWSIAQDLRWPWALEKFVSFSSTFGYIGFQWSLESKTVSLPTVKHEKYLGKLVSWTLGTFVSLQATELIIGTLNHITLVIPTGQSHLPSLYKFCAGFPSNSPPWVKHRITSAIMVDITWWIDTLHSHCSLQIYKPPPPLDITLHVDASISWGIDLNLNGKWLAWKLLLGWKTSEHNIHC